MTSHFDKEERPHSHAGHAHALGPGASRRRLALALALVVLFMAGEVGAGILAHSLALLADAAHMLTDAGAIGLSLFALSLAARPARGALTYGFKRAEILSAQVNGATLLVLAVLIVYEAIQRLVEPPAVQGWTVLGVALGGVVCNLLATWQLGQANRDNLAIEGSFQHLLTDLYAFTGTLVAGAVIVTTGFARADVLASLFVAALMLWAAYGLLRDSGRVLLEAAPKGKSPLAIAQALAAEAEVVDVHDLHVWQISSGFPALSAHVLVREGADCHAIRRELESVLAERFAIKHTTLQVDHRPERQLAQITRRAVAENKESS